MSIPFTQYLMPDGRKKPITIERPEKVEARAQAIIDQGYRFEAEVLTTDEVSLTIFDPGEEEDVAIELCQNGPEVPEAVDRLIANFEALQAAAERTVE